MKKNYTVAIRSGGNFRTTFVYIAFAGLLLLALPFTGCKKSTLPILPGEVSKIQHVVVIYMENHSFDNLYGQFAGADGLSGATAAEITQVDATGTP